MQSDSDKSDTRPCPPQLTDKDIDALYAHADSAEIELDCLKAKFAALFHDYRIASFEWDRARGLLSKEALDGAVPEARRERDEARARARGEAARRDRLNLAQDGARAPLPAALREDMENFLHDAKAGVTALRLLLEGQGSGLSPHAELGPGMAAVHFAINGIGQALECLGSEINEA